MKEREWGGSCLENLEIYVVFLLKCLWKMFHNLETDNKTKV